MVWPDGDLLVVRELRSMVSAALRRGRTAPRVAAQEHKWLDWPQYLHVVAELRRECAVKTSAGRLRRPAQVAWSLQRYLLFAILACVPGQPAPCFTATCHASASLRLSQHSDTGHWHPHTCSVPMEGLRPSAACAVCKRNIQSAANLRQLGRGRALNGCTLQGSQPAHWAVMWLLGIAGQAVSAAWCLHNAPG